MSVFIEILELAKGLILGIVLFAFSPLAHAQNLVNLIIIKILDHTSVVGSRTVVRRHLDAGLAGDVNARQRYDDLRLIRGQDFPQWIIAYVETKIARGKKALPPDDYLPGVGGWFKSNMLELEQRLEEEIFAPWPRATKAKLWQKRYQVGSQSAQRIINTVELSPHSYPNRGLANEINWTGATARKRRYDLFNEFHRTLTPLLYLGVWLEDFLSLHPCDLSPIEKHTIINNCATPWDLVDQSIIQRILAAESELQELLGKYNITTGDRSRAVYKLVSSTITKSSLKGVTNWIISRQPQERPKTAPTPATPRKTVSAPTQRLRTPSSETTRDRVKSFARSRASLTRNQRNQIVHFILKMDNEGLVRAQDNLDALKTHPEEDLVRYLALRYHELTAATVATTAVSQPIRPVATPKLLVLDTPEQLLSRISSAQQADYQDILYLRKLVKSQEIPSVRLEEAVRHLICFNLAHEGHLSGLVGRPSRVKLGTLANRYALPGLVPVYGKAVKQLVREGIIIRRNTAKYPRSSDPVKLSDPQMHKYK